MNIFLKKVFQFVSILSHPLLIPTYVLFILMTVNPFLFGVNEPLTVGKFFSYFSLRFTDGANALDSKPEVKALILLTLSVFFITFVLPVASMLMMKFLGLVQSLELKDRKERIIPLILTGIFYLWLFYNFYKRYDMHPAYTSFILGATIALFTDFFINNFTKISLHATGMGGLTAFIALSMWMFTDSKFNVPLTSTQTLQVSMNVLLMGSILATGLVCTARLYLKAHRWQDIAGGLFIGMAAQFIAFRIMI